MPREWNKHAWCTDDISWQLQLHQRMHPDEATLVIEYVTFAFLPLPFNHCGMSCKVKE